MSQFDIDQCAKMLAIDKESLDTDVERQPEIFWHVSDALVHAIDRRDRVEESVTQLYAELDRAVRQELEDNGVKGTEASIKNTIIEDEEYQEAKTGALDARFEAARWQNMKEAFHQRNYMLREIVNLLISGYLMPDARGDFSGAAAARKRGAEEGKAKMAEAREEATPSPRRKKRTKTTNTPLGD